MIAGNTVGYEHQSRAIILSAPHAAARAHADLLRFIHFGVRVGFVLPFVPSPPAEDAEPTIERLFEIRAKAVLYGGLQGMRRRFPEWG